ncbi:ribosomal protein S12 [Labrenzia sp. EL_126]|nr:ribosomal protein S12 [Labrenzia sp. EL_126]
MVRGSNNWKCRCDLINEIRLSSYIPQAIHTVQERWGRSRTVCVYNKHIRPLIKLKMLISKDFSELN